MARPWAVSCGYLGASGKKNQNIGRSRGGLTSKIHALCDALGNPLKFVVTAGQVNDFTQAEALLENVDGQYVLADIWKIIHQLRVVHLFCLGLDMVKIIVDIT